MHATRWMTSMWMPREPWDAKRRTAGAVRLFVRGVIAAARVRGRAHVRLAQPVTEAFTGAMAAFAALATTSFFAFFCFLTALCACTATAGAASTVAVPGA